MANRIKTISGGFMKQPKKLTRDQKFLLTRAGYDAKEWMFVEEDEQAIRIINKKTKEMEWVEK